MIGGTLRLGSTEVECHVLETGHRVLTQRGVVRLLLGGTAHGHFGRYLARIPYEHNPIDAAPICFAAGQPGMAHGYPAEAVMAIVEAMTLSARHEACLVCSRLIDERLRDRGGGHGGGVRLAPRANRI